MFYPTEFYTEEYIKQQKKREEKKKIRKAANLLGAAFFIMTAFMILWSVPLGFAMASGSVNTNTVKEILSDTTILQVVQIFISSVAFILSYFLYAKFMKVRVSDIASFKKADRPDLILPFVLLGLGVCGFSNFATSIAGSIFQRMGFEYNLNTVENPTNIYGIILAFIATAVTPALVEEFAMRGVVLGVLRKYGDGFAILMSALVFGLMHGNFVQIPFAFILGLIFAYAVIKTGTIWTAVIIHFINNFISISLDYLSKNIDTTMLMIVNLFYLILLVFVGFIGYIMLNKKGEGNFTVENKDQVLTVPEKIGAFLSSPCIIITFIVVIIEALFVYV